MKRNPAMLFTRIRPLIEQYNKELLEELNREALFWMPEAFYGELNDWILRNIQKDPNDIIAIRIYSELTTHSVDIIRNAFLEEKNKKK